MTSKIARIIQMPKIYFNGNAPSMDIINPGLDDCTAIVLSYTFDVI